MVSPTECAMNGDGGGWVRAGAGATGAEGGLDDDDPDDDDDDDDDDEAADWLRCAASGDPALAIPSIN